MEHLDTFLARWQKAGGTERANYQLFLTELCSLLGLPLPEPAGDDTRDNAYVFERRVVINQPDGSSNNGFIDLYKRGSFVLEAKQTGKTLDSSGWDKAMLKAHNQADQYARALPAEEGRPPFILVVDVGRNIELYAEFSRSGATYTPYPDALNHRIRLEDLRKEEVRERLRAVWLDPLSLDPSRRSARVTREIADQLAKLAKSLEADGHPPQLVASFLMRALFTMFAEDVGLLPERGFTELLQRLKNKPDTFAPMLEHLWQAMNSGGFSPILESTLLKFNGGLFAEAQAIALDRDQMELLLKASEADWRYVEPAIFGTLLERALNPRERHKLGAHYTPRAYVERLVLPTVIEPLRAEWKEVQVAALTYEGQGKHKEAVAEIRAFHRHLCEVRVLDPACGSGNFLYVTLEHMKRLEGEVLNLLHDLGESQGLLELEGVTVDPHQFLGLEINPRAARIAEMVLWIGYLQWHFRTHGKVNPPEPVLRDFHNIEHRDALIAYDAVELLRDEAGKPITRWDGITTKTSPITGEQVPDESAQVEQYIYRNPRKAEWPQAEYIVGNPPFIGASTMRRALGDGYVDAVRATWKEVPESADFVMHWWHIAAEAVRAGSARQFGFITTNSIKQTFNRRVVQAQLEAKNPLTLAFAIPDHPWVDAGDGAQVRIAMTVGSGNDGNGRLLQVRDENSSDQNQDEIEVNLQELTGRMFADLKIGADIGGSVPLRSNSQVSNRGLELGGAGFIVDKDEATNLGLRSQPNLQKVIRPYCNGKDLTQVSRQAFVIDCFGLEADEVREKFPTVYQRLLERVKPERDQNRAPLLREKWWLHRRLRGDLRQALAGLDRYAATVETSKHRFFVFLPAAVAPDNMLVVIASDDASKLGILSSRIHIAWALAAGGRLGVGNDPRYNKTRCFETFPFPDATPEQQIQIRELAERLDAHRKRQQAQHPELTLTGMYNVLEKLRAGEPLNAKEKIIHEQGLVSVLRELHDELDSAVFAAYGWDDLAAQLVGKPGATTPLPDKPEAQAEAEEELLCRLVALNAERAAEEARGLVHWLRPEYQNPSAAVAPEQSEAELDDTTDFESTPAAAAATGKLTWPKQMREQVAAVRHALSQSPLPADALAAQFKRSPKVAVQAVLDALEELGMVQQADNSYRLAS
ncbi:class I SAM-dependent DNA methyltransferase (plasmid) [Pseudomonas fulva]|uniref:site-specific DNA-methyltransferase (adenine-specific) n=1 Tax=Pseudomonas fulva TaxID=47880 RepID=A0A7S9QBL3_9PSED|nr:class I SAM-dependent DNA methyltransferase [Pseudomonas fulva]QPH47016.1 class I SAM-dependent DNA methyltransferase [Pseudomonas fulva]QPH52191.1 class I SAM-dependent DNA methyltransferase [Pseudomonas fulva]